MEVEGSEGERNLVKGDFGATDVTERKLRLRRHVARNSECSCGCSDCASDYEAGGPVNWRDFLILMMLGFLSLVRRWRNPARWKGRDIAQHVNWRRAGVDRLSALLKAGLACRWPRRNLGSEWRRRRILAHADSPSQTKSGSAATLAPRSSAAVLAAPTRASLRFLGAVLLGRHLVWRLPTLPASFDSGALQRVRSFLDALCRSAQPSRARASDEVRIGALPAVRQYRGRPLRACCRTLSAPRRLHAQWRHRARARLHASPTKAGVLGAPGPVARTDRAARFGSVRVTHPQASWRAVTTLLWFGGGESW